MSDYKWRDIGDGKPVRVRVCPECGVAPSNVDDCGEFGNPDCPYFGIGREEFERQRSIAALRKQLEQAQARVAELEDTVDRFILATTLASVNGYGQDDVHRDDSWIDALDETLDRARRLRQQDAYASKTP